MNRKEFLINFTSQKFQYDFDPQDTEMQSAVAEVEYLTGIRKRPLKARLNTNFSKCVAVATLALGVLPQFKTFMDNNHELMLISGGAFLVGYNVADYLITMFKSSFNEKMDN